MLILVLFTWTTMITHPKTVTDRWLITVIYLKAFNLLEIKTATKYVLFNKGYGKTHPKNSLFSDISHS